MESHTAFVISKAVTQYFNPEEYAANKTMAYTS
jgi:hypothetical protein